MLETGLRLRVFIVERIKISVRVFYMESQGVFMKNFTCFPP